MGEDDEARATAARVRAYYAGHDRDLDLPLLSPALATDFSGLPPAGIVLAELDPLRDEGHEYGVKLARDGVEVEVFEYRMTHTIATTAAAEGWLDDLVGFARRHL